LKEQRRENLNLQQKLEKLNEDISEVVKKGLENAFNNLKMPQ